MRLGLTDSAAGGRRTPAAPASAWLALGLSLAIAFAVDGLWSTAQAGQSEASRALLAANLDPSKAAVCHRVEEIRPALFAGRDITAYDFTGETARKLKQVMDAVIEQPVPDASLVHVVVGGTKQALAFLFGTDGCHTVTLDLDLTAMDAVFASAGVPSPFDAKLARLNGVAI